MAGSRVTIEDIAEKLGLSKFSISRALSGKPGVADATRARVLRAAHAMGYRVAVDMPHQLGQILFVRQELDPASSEGWLKVQHGAESEGERLGYAVVPRQARFLDPDANDPAAVGLILAMTRPGELAELAARTGLPVGCAGPAEPQSRFDHVSGADWEAGVAVARHLTQQGHRSVAFVRTVRSPPVRTERLRGFRDGMLETAGAVVEEITFDETHGFRRALETHLSTGGRPTALFCAHDGIAVGVVSELLQAGLRIPTDLSVVGFGDLAAAGQISPRLTTVRTPYIEMGALLVRAIAERLAHPENGARPPMRITIASEIVRRESSGPANEADWTQRLHRLAAVA